MTGAKHDNGGNPATFQAGVGSSGQRPGILMGGMGYYQRQRLRFTGGRCRDSQVVIHTLLQHAGIGRVE